MVKVIKMGLILAVFCILSAWGLAYIYQFTKPQIEKNSKQAMVSSKQAVLPPSGKGVVRQILVKGYSSDIEILVGIDKDRKVSGLKILSQRETPGLGAKIVQKQFLDQFIGKQLGDPLEPKKDIDAITGATISSRAVCNGVRQVLKSALGGDK